MESQDGREWSGRGREMSENKETGEQLSLFELEGEAQLEKVAPKKTVPQSRMRPNPRHSVWRASSARFRFRNFSRKTATCLDSTIPEKPC
ncbi:MAG: hypothetical protein UZ16_OP3001002632 [Candidatus Hinthialibacteria bacterium OLB16]|nr:MAG: hypothetical protein UZ16_OP3001002632 [Candidatus Hinthialibacteria bacterium OLB16]